MAKFNFEYGRLPDFDKPEEVEEVRALYEESYPQAFRDMITVIDEHCQQDKRIQLLIEAIPDEKFEKEMQDQEKLKQAVVEIGMRVAEGNFDEALVAFKQMAEIRASSSRERDPRFAKRIANASKDENVIAVVGTMGGNHTPLTDLITEEGSEVIPVEDANEEVSPRDEVINTRYHSPDEEVSELKWYRGMLGGAIEDYYAEIAEGEYQAVGTITTPTIMRQYARWYLEKLPDMESIRSFERQVKQEGFHGALTRLYEQ